jgi:hypothetical protein
VARLHALEFSVTEDHAARFLWFATIQPIERNKSLVDLTPQLSLRSGWAGPRQSWEISQTQKAMREVDHGLLLTVSFCGIG